MKANNNVLTGTTSLNVESRVMKLLFICSVAKGARTDAKGILDDLASATIEVEKQTSQGGQPIIPELPFTDLLEIAAANEGCIDMRTNGTNYELRATVELSDLGAIEVKENEFFKIKLANFTSVNVDVYAVEADLTTDVHNVYKTIFVNANTPKTLDVRNSRWLAIPDTSAKKLELIDARGRITTYEKEELRQVCNEGNPIAATDDQKIYSGYLNLLVMNVGWAAAARITMSANTNVYIVNYEQL